MDSASIKVDCPSSSLSARRSDGERWTPAEATVIGASLFTLGWEVPVTLRARAGADRRPPPALGWTSRTGVDFASGDVPASLLSARSHRAGRRHVARRRVVLSARATPERVDVMRLAAVAAELDFRRGKVTFGQWAGAR